MDLYEIVDRYSRAGHHRTASSVEGQTLNWLESLLQAGGAAVSRHAYAVDRYEAEVTGSGSAEGVFLDALYYSAIGKFAAAPAHVARLEFDEEHSDAHLKQELCRIAAEAKAAGKGAAIVATGSADAGLCQINRAPQTPGSFPICLAAGADFEKLAAEPAEIAFRASITQSTSENLIARFPGPTPDGLPLVVTTPLSGWFNCAGERGTGLAIAISVAQKLAAHRDIVLVMPTGHELGFLGAERFVETFDEPVAGVLHLGSCVADRGAHGPDGYMRAVTNLDRTGFQVASDALSKERIELEAARDPADPACWIGESELWAPKRLPMVSIAGTSPNFHTPADTVENATSRELLERMDACVLNAAQALIGHNRN